MPPIRWLLTRLLGAAVTLLGVSVLIFAAVRAMPGSYTDLVLGSLATQDEKARAAAEFGLDRPLVEQYVHWLRAFLSGDFGTSLAGHTPVAAELADRAPVTAALAGLALLATLLTGVPLGVWAGVRGASHGGAVGRLLGGLGLSLPEFALGSVVVFLFTRYDLGLTVGGQVSFSHDPLGAVRALLLPAAVLAVFCTAATVRTTRAAVLGVLVEPHIAAAVARGEPKGFIVRHHVLRNASVPVLTLLTTLTAYLLGGAVIVERLFTVPGLGSYLVDGTDRRDYAVVQAGVLLAAAVFITANLLADLAAGLVDPRLRRATT